MFLSVLTSAGCIAEVFAFWVHFTSLMYINMLLVCFGAAGPQRAAAAPVLNRDMACLNDLQVASGAVPASEGQGDAVAMHSLRDSESNTSGEHNSCCCRAAEEPNMCPGIVLECYKL